MINDRKQEKRFVGRLMAGKGRPPVSVFIGFQFFKPGNQFIEHRGQSRMVVRKKSPYELVSA